LIASAKRVLVSAMKPTSRRGRVRGRPSLPRGPW
jgi:hypothetical protein